jgi:thioredoxin-dependent peroxiredoxin
MRIRPAALLLPLLLVTACAKEQNTPATGPATTDSAPIASASASAAPTTAAPVDVAEGKPTPAFSVTASDGTKIDSAAMKGKPIVLYFYPKDETPGCTTEACSFRDAWEKLAKSGVVMVGVSTDSDESHKAFAAHHKLPFHLVSDPDGKLAKTFGVTVNGTFMSRQTIVIGADGNVKRIYRTVDVTKHAAEISADLGV